MSVGDDFFAPFVMGWSPSKGKVTPNLHWILGGAARPCRQSRNLAVDWTFYENNLGVEIIQ
jgi:hypothetical protein